MCIITKSHPPNSFHYAGRKTSIVISIIELSKKVLNNLISQVPTDNDEMRAHHLSHTELATKLSTTYEYAQKKPIRIYIQ